jgi:hypothetical protein
MTEVKITINSDDSDLEVVESSLIRAYGESERTRISALLNRALAKVDRAYRLSEKPAVEK